MAKEQSERRVGRPKKKYSQGARLLKLYEMLHRGRSLRAGDLAERFSITRRTAERDIEALYEVLEHKIYRKDRADGGAEHVLVGEAGKWKVTHWQVMAILIGTRMTTLLSGLRFVSEVEPLLDQLRSSLAPGKQIKVGRLEKKLHVRQTGHKLYNASVEVQKILAVMIDGLFCEKPVSVRYSSHRGRQSGQSPRALVVHPLSLVVHSGGAYVVVDVVGGDWTEANTRIMLAIDRIESARGVEGAAVFDYPTDYDPDEYFEHAFGIWAGDDVQEVVLRIDAGYAPYVMERCWHRSQRFEEDPEGTIVMRLELGALFEVADWILGMGEHVEVIEPVELRDLVRRRLAGALELYSGANNPAPGVA